MRGKPLVLKKLDNGCIIPTSHKLKEKAKAYWMQTHCTGAALASLVGVTFSAACAWIREWKA